jgi:hypothetical protein
MESDKKVRVEGKKKKKVIVAAAATAPAPVQEEVTPPGKAAARAIILKLKTALLHDTVPVIKEMTEHAKERIDEAYTTPKQREAAVSACERKIAAAAEDDAKVFAALSSHICKQVETTFAQQQKIDYIRSLDDTKIAQHRAERAKDRALKRAHETSEVAAVNADTTGTPPKKTTKK